jgi:uncharacterized OB-fold protein
MNGAPLELACPHIRLRDGVRPVLMGSRCDDCAELYFPPSRSCTRCLSLQLQPVEIGDRGILWSWTIQAFLPKAPYDGGEMPEDFQPYGVGYVEMPSGIKVEARLTVADAASLHIGMPMALTLARYGAADREQAPLTFAFEPENAQ